MPRSVDYMARGFMIFMRGVDITRAIGRVGLKVEPDLGPKQASQLSGFWAVKLFEQSSYTSIP